jgi:hypothetical protein
MDGSVGVRPVGMNLRVLAVLAALALAGCSSFGSKADVPLPDPNTYPANYRADIVTFLRLSLNDRALFHGAMIAQPVLKPIVDAQRYMVCVQLNGHGETLNKVAIYVGGRIQQFVDSSPDQCGDAAYQPFKELAAAIPAA